MTDAILGNGKAVAVLPIQGQRSWLYLREIKRRGDQLGCDGGEGTYRGSCAS